MRQSANVKVVLTQGESVAPNDTVIEGEIRDVTTALASLAEIAWAQGWRPRALSGTLARVVETFKIPAVES